MGTACAGPPKMHLESDRFKNYDELIQAIEQAGLSSMRCVISVDFSSSNGDLHSLDPSKDNPYLKVIKVLEPVLQKFDTSNETYAYRFGCIDSQELKVLPLYGEDPVCTSFDQIISNYKTAAETVQMSGPTTFTHTIKKCIELEKQLGGKEFIFCVFITDGVVSDPEEDILQLKFASKYPISFVAVGVGKGPFGLLENFDDKFKGKFDNFQFVNLNEITEISKRHERPDLVFSTALFNEVPDHYKNVKKLGYL
ncbi:Copine_I [Hexamita inflata]|uniref:Copine_I n=1 Tax=Hexamita inflata TaxID=28002 RepID=A0ABP1ISN0_9EUKA